MKTKYILTLLFCTLLVCGANAQTTFLWASKASIPITEHPNGARALGVAALKGKIYTVGGLNWPNAIPTVLQYNPLSDTWTKKANMLSPRYAPAAAALKGKLYAIGGDAGNAPLATVEQYDPMLNAWTSKASMNQARFAFQAVTLAGKIYAIGGTAETVGNDNPLASVERYNPISNTWTPMADMPTARLSFGAAVLNGKIYVIGGRIFNTLIPEVWEYTPWLNTWAIKAAMPAPRASLAVVAINGKILALGGDNGTPGGLATIEEYNPRTDTWTSKPNLPTGRNECFAVNLEILISKLFVFGGYDDNSMIALLNGQRNTCFSDHFGRLAELADYLDNN